MIHEYRTYTMHPGQLEAYLELAETRVQPIRQDKYGKLVGFWYSEFGTLHQVHHIWEYPSLDRRRDDRKALFQRKDWMDQFIAGAWPTMQTQDVRFMNPLQDYAMPDGKHALYETRIYRSVVGRFDALGAAVALRPIAPKATRVGLWTGEAPTPNEVCEIIAYRSFEDRVADRCQSDDQRAWLREYGKDMLAVDSTLLLPIGISPVQ